MNNISLIIKRDEDDKEAAEVLVQGCIYGKKYEFLLDTGAARTCVKFDNFTKTLDCIERASSAGVFAKTSNDIIRIPNIKVGPIVKENISVVRYKEGINEIRNLIGMDILKDYRLYFDFGKNIAAVKQIDELEENLSLLELELGNKFHPYVDIDLGDVSGKAVWDTGAGITVVDMNFIRKNSKYFIEVGQSVGTDSTGAENETPMFIMSDVRIGNWEFTGHKVAGVELSLINSSTEIPMNMILGYTTLRKANWYFDFQGKKWGVLKLNN